MIVFCISPSYLTAIKREADAYSFSLQAYGGLKKGLAGLAKTNASEIMGFSLVLEELPKDKGLLLKFLKACDMISEQSRNRKRFVFGLKEAQGVNDLISDNKFKHLDIYICKYDVVTDMFIKRDVFGTIILGYNTPYDGPKIGNRKEVSSATSMGIKYSPIFTPIDMESIEEVRVRPTIKETEIEDMYLSELRGKSLFHYALRKFAIKKAHNPRLVNDSEVEKLLRDIKSLRTSIHYSMLYELVQRGL